MDKSVAAFSVWDDIWQLALRRKIAGNVFVVTRGNLQMLTLCSMWIEHNNSLLEYLTRNLNRTNLIGIPCDNKKEMTTG